MAVTFNQAILGTSNNGAYGAEPQSTPSFTPTAGDAILAWALDYSAGSAPLVISGTGTYSSIATDSSFHGTHQLSANSSASSGAQVATATSTSSDDVVTFALDYSGVGTVSGTYTQNSSPGAGTGAIVGSSVTVPSGGILVAFAIDLHTNDTNALVGASGTTGRGSGKFATFWPYLISEYAGTGAAIQPSFTDATNGATSDYFVGQFLLSPSGGASSQPGQPSVIVPIGDLWTPKMKHVAFFMPLAWLIDRRRKLTRS